MCKILIQQFLRSLRETGTDLHQSPPKGTSRYIVVSTARYRPWVKLTGLELVPAQEITNWNKEAPTSIDPNIVAQYQPWVALTRNSGQGYSGPVQVRCGGRCLYVLLYVCCIIIMYSISTLLQKNVYLVVVVVEPIDLYQKRSQPWQILPKKRHFWDFGQTFKINIFQYIEVDLKKVIDSELAYNCE